MLLIIHLMLSSVQISERVISCYFAATAPRARFSVAKDRTVLVFSCFFQAGMRVPRRCRALFNPGDEALVTPGEWERAPLIESSGHSTVLIPVEAVSPELAGRVWGFR